MTTPTPIKPELLSPAGSPEALAAALDAANVPHDRRADALSPDEFLAVVNALSEQPSLEQ